MNDQYSQFIDTIQSLCVKREHAYPVRDHAYNELTKIIRDFSIYLLNSHVNNNFTPNRQIVHCIENFRNNPIFICGNMKSGTTLLTQLLDGHSNLVVLPGDSRYIAHFHNKHLSYEDLFEYWIARLINPTGKQPFWFLGNKQETFHTFADYLKYFYNQSDPDLFLAALYSIYASNPIRTENPKNWVEKTCGNHLYTNLFLNKFPKAKFIHILRDPLTNLASLKKYSFHRNRSFSLVRKCRTIRQSFKRARINRTTYGDEIYKIILYEDLISNTQDIMQDIAEFLDINYEDNLSIPTENLKPGVANSMYEESRLKGKVHDQSTSRKWRNELREFEKKVIITFLAKDAISMGYDYWKMNDIKKYHMFSFLK